MWWWSPLFSFFELMLYQRRNTDRIPSSLKLLSNIILGRIEVHHLSKHQWRSPRPIHIARFGSKRTIEGGAIEKFEESQKERVNIVLWSYWAMIPFLLRIDSGSASPAWVGFYGHPQRIHAVRTSEESKSEGFGTELGFRCDGLMPVRHLSF